MKNSLSCLTLACLLLLAAPLSAQSRASSRLIKGLGNNRHDGVTSVSLVASSGRAAVGFFRGEVGVWRTSGELQKRFRVHRTRVVGVDFSGRPSVGDVRNRRKRIVGGALECRHH